MADKETILVIAAHPDDEVLGCGGTVARLSREGHPVFIAILGEGQTSRVDQPDVQDRKIVKNLKTQAKLAAEALGVQKIFTFDLPDNRFDSVPLLDVVKIVEKIIADVTPSIVFTHHQSDLNVDHQITSRAVLTGTRPVPGQKIHSLYAFEVPSATEWSFQRISPPFQPNYFVDIRDTFDLKVKALSFYDGEMRCFPHPRSPEALKHIARRWGSVVGLESVEAFEVIRSVRAAE